MGGAAPTAPAESLAFARDEFRSATMTIDNSRPHHISGSHQ
jgi:hypothetical protein